MIGAMEVLGWLMEEASCIRRVVKWPERRKRFVETEAKSGEKLPTQPDSKAFNDFLMKRKAADPDHFADVSLAVIKLMGPSEYVLERPCDTAKVHFGLAGQD